MIRLISVIFYFLSFYFVYFFIHGIFLKFNLFCENEFWMFIILMFIARFGFALDSNKK